MRRYSTEVFVPADRHVVVQLPDGMPEGRAIIVVQTLEARDDADGPFLDEDDDRDDIEWWDEFDDELADSRAR